jgi:hypothetical protein
VRRGSVEQPGDPPQQWPAGGSHREPRRRPSCRFELGQRPRVRDAIAAEGDGEIVAAVFALGPGLARQPPHARMVEEQRLDRGLHQVGEIVVPPHVRQLVSENRLQLVWRQPGERARWHEHHRLEPAEDGGDLQDRRLEERHALADLHSSRQTRKSIGPRRRRRSNAVPAQPLCHEPAAARPERKHGNAERPEQRGVGQKALYVTPAPSRRARDLRRGKNGEPDRAGLR